MYHEEEHRRFARIAFAAPARLSLATRMCECEVLDLSFKGALLRLRGVAGLEGGEACSLDLPLGERQERISMAGRIAHVEGQGEGQRIGLACQSIDVDSLTHLRRLIELNSLDPALFERDLAALVADAARK